MYAPFNGEVTMVFNTKHAIGLTSNSGAQLMIHIGIDTVKLNGKYFDVLVKQGDQIKQGQKLLHFDIDKITEAGYDCSTVAIVTNSKDYQNIELLTTGPTNHGESVLKVEI